MNDPSQNQRPLPSTAVWWALLVGVGGGLFLGDYAEPLKIVGDAFVGLLQMTILPYVMVTLMASLGRLTRSQSRRLAKFGGLVLLTLWGVGVVMVVGLAQTFPPHQQGVSFSATVAGASPGFDFVALFIPSNVFKALADSVVPAVIVFCIFTGIALIGLEGKWEVITALDRLSALLGRVNRMIVRLTPLGVCVIATYVAGTFSWTDIFRLQVYLITYTCGAVTLIFVLLPLFVTACTPYRYGEVMRVSQAALVTVFATGKLILALPMLVEQTNRLMRAHDAKSPSATGQGPAADVLYPLAYPFPHLGKLLALLFIPYVAWYFGTPLRADDYPSLLAVGVASHFAGPIVATSYLLEFMQLPHDMLELFVVSGVYCGRLGDAVGVMHLVAFTLVGGAAISGKLRISGHAGLKAVAISVVAVAGVGGLLWVGLRSTQPSEDAARALANDQLQLDDPVSSTVRPTPAPNPVPLSTGETVLQRVRRRGILRVGFNEDNLPFAFINARGELVGFDISMAHRLARDLHVAVEFIPWKPSSLVDQLRADHFDVVMSGLPGTLERSEQMVHTGPYLDVTMALVVEDFRAREFSSIDKLRRLAAARIAFVDIDRELLSELGKLSPNLEFVELSSHLEFFEGDAHRCDGLLISAESGSAFTRRYPRYEVVIPAGRRVQMPLFYAIAGRDLETRDFVEHWMMLRTKDGTIQEQYDYWILGRRTEPKQPRWSVIRDLWHWVP